MSHKDRFCACTSGTCRTELEYRQKSLQWLVILILFPLTQVKKQLDDQASAKQKLEQEVEFSQQQQQQHAEGNAGRIADLQQQITEVGLGVMQMQSFYLSFLFFTIPQMIWCIVKEIYSCTKCYSIYIARNCCQHCKVIGMVFSCFPMGLDIGNALHAMTEWSFRNISTSSAAVCIVNVASIISLKPSEVYISRGEYNKLISSNCFQLSFISWMLPIQRNRAKWKTCINSSAKQGRQPSHNKDKPNSRLHHCSYNAPR